MLLTLYLIVPALLVAVVLASVWLERWSVPVILVALGTGIVCGSDVLNVWHFDDMVLTNQFANLALVFILFHGGFMTKRADFRAVALPAGGLATWGVLLTAAGLLLIDPGLATDIAGAVLAVIVTLAQWYGRRQAAGESPKSAPVKQSP